ncbi:hypothetical protein, partial [Erwinia tracheiphila]|uniref:hypothetical protein n=1 Tax=Erwinia tracheiphila TaxID=65700 RepID=UPI001E2C1A17
MANQRRHRSFLRTNPLPQSRQFIPEASQGASPAWGSSQRQVILAMTGWNMMIYRRPAYDCEQTGRDA